MQDTQDNKVTIKFIFDESDVPIDSDCFMLESGGIGYILHQYHKDEYADDLAQYPTDLVENKDKLLSTLEKAQELVAEKGGNVLYVEKPICLYTDEDFKELDARTELYKEALVEEEKRINDEIEEEFGFDDYSEDSFSWSNIL